MSFLAGMHQNKIVWTEMFTTPTKPKVQLSFVLPAFLSHKKMSTFCFLFSDSFRVVVLLMGFTLSQGVTSC